MISKPLVVVTTTVLAVAAAGCTETAESGGSPSEAPEQQSSEINSGASCANTELFVKAGVAEDLRKTVSPSFIQDGYYVVVPGAVTAFDSFGGDMVQTVLGVGTSAARVFDVNPGGAFSATIAGHVTGDAFQRKGMAAARALFDAMTQAKELETTESGWTTRKRTSVKGSFECQVRAQDGAVRDASCTIRDLFFSRVVSRPAADAGMFCVR